MGVYIKGMRMPPRCGRCDLCIQEFDNGTFDHYECCITAAIIDNLGEKMDDCPLVPVPPHGRLGDLDRLADSFEPSDFWNSDAGDNCFAAIHIVHSAPTIIEAEPLKEET